jgi:uncharacterized damage-inducible protein DinB
MAGKDVPLGPVESMLRAFAIHNRIHLYLLDHISPEAWLLVPPGGKGRTLAAMVAHMHSVRLMWLKAAKVDQLPAPLELDARISEARMALTASAATMETFLKTALESGRVPNFKPDAWAFVSYLIAHEAHHRGQMMQLARMLGFPLDKSVNFGMWEWGVR